MVDEPMFASPGPPLGLVCERGTALTRGPRRFESPVCLAPLEASVVAVGCEGQPGLRIDKTSVLLIPAGVSYRLESASAIVYLATFVLHPAIRGAALAEYGHETDFAGRGDLFDEVILLPRTVWVNELCHRYVFERAHCHKHASLAARFVEIELTKELFFLVGERRTRIERGNVGRGKSPMVERALAHMEEHLFDPLDMGTVARRAGASESTLLRAFKREVGTTPSNYLRGRRLDEAMLLLKSRRESVGEIAQRVGYRSVASFTHAFSRHFGVLPSAVR